MSSVKIAISYSVITRFGIRLIGLISTMVVARLLTPDEIGTYAIASSVIMIAVEFRLLGAGNFLIREKILNKDLVRSVLGLSILISWSLGLLILFVSSLFGKFYGLPELQWIFAILSISFFVSPYISIPTALLSRNLSFKVQFHIRIISSIIGLFFTLLLIRLDFGILALAIGQSSISISQFVLFIFIRPDGMSYLPSFFNIGRVAKFGIITSIALLFRKAYVTIPDLIIGKIGTTSDVGMFSRAIGFIEFVSQSIMMGIQPVALPYFSNTNKHDGDLINAYIKSSVLLGAIVIPILGVASLASLPIIRLFFGDQWDSAAPAASWIAYWAIFRCIHWFSNDVLITTGKENLLLIKDAVPLILLAYLIFIAYPFGLERVGFMFFIVGIIEFTVTSIILFFTIRLSFIQFLKAWRSNLIVFVTCYLTTWAMGQVIPFHSIIAWKVVVVLLSIVPAVWLLSISISKNPLYYELRKIIINKRIF